MIVCDVDFTIFSTVNHRVNHLAHSNASTLRSEAHVRGNNSSRDIQPRHTRTGLVITVDIRDVNTAAGFLGVVAGNLATKNGDMGAVIGSKPSAAVVTIAIVATEFSHSIIRDIAARNIHDAALGHNAATESLVECAITGDYAISYGDRGAFSIHTAAIRSAVAGNYATGQLKGRGSTFIVGHHNACARTRARSATHVAAAHVDGRAVFGIDEVADVAILCLREHTACKIEHAA